MAFLQLRSALSDLKKCWGKQMKYSVIVPVYKAEGTLEKCIKSLLTQPHEGAEILLINDGSPDRSGEICEKYAAEYECVRYFYKENGGVSSARNLGLDNASGEYILFVDSDDYVSENYFEAIEKEMLEYSPEMLVWGSVTNETDNVNSIGVFFSSNMENTASKIAPALRGNMFSQLWCRSFFRRIIEKYNIRFNCGLNIAEDIAFILEYICHISSIRSIDIPLYVQTLDNQESLSRKRRADLAESLLAANEQMLDCVETISAETEVYNTYKSAVTWLFFRSAYSACKELLKYNLSRRERRKKIRKICRMFSRENIKPMDLKCRIIALPIKLKSAFVIDYLIRR